MWTTNIPTEPGWYWFYGNQFKSTKLELKIVRVWNNGPVVCEGAFMYEQELGPVRWFKPLEVPEASELAELVAIG